jgi:predicted pyridoxine 5'-phosphate oxidase superfamily flavin-nucleotide-binding protein
MKIPQSIQEIFKEDKAVVFGTATPDGNPNINMIGLKKIQDDETIILADNYFNKTLANVLKNNKGTILTEGPEYEEIKQWVKSVKETLPAKGMIVFKVEKIYNSIPGPNAGNLIEEK